MRFFGETKQEKDPIELFIEKAEAKIDKLDREINSYMKKDSPFLGIQNEQIPYLLHLPEMHMRELVASVDNKNTAKDIVIMWHKSSALLEIVDKINEVMNHPDPSKKDYEDIKRCISEQKKQKEFEMIGGEESKKSVISFSIMDKRGILPSDIAKMITDFENTLDDKIAALPNKSTPSP